MLKTTNIKKYIYNFLIESLNEEKIDHINKNFSVKITKEYLFFYKNKEQIGEIQYFYNGTSMSFFVPDSEKEFYLEHIMVYPEHRGNRYADIMLEYVKKFAKSLGATIITLRVDYGLGYNKQRNPNSRLDKLYLKHGFQYSFTEKEVEEDEEKSLGAMTYHIQ